MVNMNNENDELEMEITNDENVEIEETELEEEEEMSSDKLKKLREKLARCNDEKKEILDESQRAKADFLNARKRLEEEKVRDRVRQRIQHVEELLPLCDSFQMAMKDKDAWEQAPESWRKGVEGINMQLMRIIDSYEVSVINAEGETFDPMRHEAVGTEEVEDKKKQDVVISVVQNGYEMNVGDKTELIRPAKVTTGIVKE